MTHVSPSPSVRKLLTVALSVGLLSAATPGVALAGGGAQTKASPSPKCDPTTTVCGDGRKNG